MIFYGTGGIVSLKVAPVDVPSLLLVSKIKFRIAIQQHLVAESGFVIPIGVGPNVEPDKF